MSIMKRFGFSILQLVLFSLLFTVLSCSEKDPAWLSYHKSTAKPAEQGGGGGGIIEEDDDPESDVPQPGEDPEPEPDPDPDPVDPSPQGPTEPEWPVDNHWFQTRGIILTWEDVQTMDWIALAKTCGINTFSINNFPSIGGKAWKDYVAKCTQNGIRICYEDHMGSQLIPRSLFKNHPEYFRMNEQGQRVDDVNFCVTNPEVQQRVRDNAIELGKAYAPTNHRYYFWGDDFGKKCHCPNCKQYTDVEQWLIVENIVIDALRTIDDKAMLAHLLYDNTMQYPSTRVLPHEGIFLQFAPIHRKWNYCISNSSVQGGAGQTHGYMTNCLKEHLKIFPVETCEVLEYWLAVTMSSNWTKPVKKIAQWYPSVYQQDIAYYASLGIRNIVTYGMWIGGDYYKAFGDIQFVKDYGNGLLNYSK